MSALVVENLGKSYLLRHQTQGGAKYQKLSDALIAKTRSLLNFHRGTEGDAGPSKEIFWALDDISFDVQDGERVGIIGRNGAGKSTLLKVISRITAPTRGSIRIAGRVSSLLEVGTGFHPELTGRENIFLNGSVLGMTRNDIRRRFDAIVQFAEVEKFLDTPVKHYSSGMYMRLAFAVAAHLEPDILIVDEVLAVGDAAFQKKCLGKMKDVGKEGRTVLFVSHNMGAISEFCNRAILLGGGKVIADGSPNEIIPMYSSGKSESENATGYYCIKDQGQNFWIREVRLLDSLDMPTSEFELIDPINIQLNYRSKARLSELQVALTILKDGVEIIHAFDSDDEQEILATEVGEYRLSYSLPPLTLKEGKYSIRIEAGTPQELMQSIDNISFEVVNNRISTLKKSYRSDRAGVIVSPGKWKRQ